MGGDWSPSAIQPSLPQFHGDDDAEEEEEEVEDEEDVEDVENVEDVEVDEEVGVWWAIHHLPAAVWYKPYFPPRSTC